MIALRDELSRQVCPDKSRSAEDDVCTHDKPQISIGVTVPHE
jgi:hypothetical protein